MPPKDPAARAEYMRAYYAANREKLIERAAAWGAAHPDRKRAINRAWYATKGRTNRAGRRDEINAYQRAWAAAHPDSERADNRRQRLRRYGLTIADYGEMMARQNGLCALCRKVETHKDRRGNVTQLAVDHDHATGSVRALLCHACNVGLGSFLDDPELLVAAADYIELHRVRG